MIEVESHGGPAGCVVYIIIDGEGRPNGANCKGNLLVEISRRKLAAHLHIGTVYISCAQTTSCDVDLVLNGMVCFRQFRLCTRVSPNGSLPHARRLKARNSISLYDPECHPHKSPITLNRSPFGAPGASHAAMPSFCPIPLVALIGHVRKCSSCGSFETAVVQGLHESEDWT